MKFLRKALDKKAHLFEKGGTLEKFETVYDIIDTFLFTPKHVTKGLTHVRDTMDLKRLMIMVAFAVTPVMMFAIWNTGYQANLAVASLGKAFHPEGWRYAIIALFGSGFDASSFISNFVHGLVFFLPIMITVLVTGMVIEIVFSAVRKHEFHEGFLVTSILFPLIVPASIPLWQVSLGTAFGVIIGKEVFGGTGMNLFNPALVGRAFLFFSYPAQISGDAVWTAVDGFTGATSLSLASAGGVEAITTGDWMTHFYGLTQGSMGETSTLLILLGGLFLIITGIGSWRTMLGVFVGMVALSFMFNSIGSDTNPAFSVPWHWHLVMGGFAFGMVFMATDPVSSAFTDTGKYIYGFLIGALVVLIRVVNPAFPEGMMLAILFGNAFAPLIDYFVVKGNIKRRKAKWQVKQ